MGEEQPKLALTSLDVSLKHPREAARQMKTEGLKGEA
jgi:hypothetical protein